MPSNAQHPYRGKIPAMRLHPAATPDNISSSICLFQHSKNGLQGNIPHPSAAGNIPSPTCHTASGVQSQKLSKNTSTNTLQPSNVRVLRTGQVRRALPRASKKLEHRALDRHLTQRCRLQASSVERPAVPPSKAPEYAVPPCKCVQPNSPRAHHQVGMTAISSGDLMLMNTVRLATPYH